MFYVLLSVCLLCETSLVGFGQSLRLGPPFSFFFFFFQPAWPRVMHICKPSSCNFSSRRALFLQTEQPKISGWPLENGVIELSWEIWFKWVALISCGNLSGTRGEKMVWRSVFKFVIWEILFSPCNKNLRDSVEGCGVGGGLLCLEIQMPQE